VIRPFGDATPRIAPSAFVEDSAQVIGDVELGDHASVWMCAVIRGDVHSIRIGAYSNIQDNCVVHVFKEKHPTVVADHVTVGHSVTLHGCRIDSYCLIGMGATILNDAHVGERSIIAAGTLVPERMVIPPGSLVMGVPGKVRRPLTDEERASIDTYANNYFEYKESYLAELKRS